MVQLLAVALPIALSLHGLRKGSLSPSGAATAFVVGALMIAGPLHVFGVSLIVFYLTGSRATKYGKTAKRELEDGYHEAGYRSGWQVVSNASGALLAAVAWNAIFVPTGVQAHLLSYVGTLPHALWPSQFYPGFCPIDPSVANGTSRRLLFAVLGHFACCLGDTLASELGILSKTPPKLITTGAVVPPGTNGGVSFLGTNVSIAGGTFMGVTMATCLALESEQCRANPAALIDLVIWGAVGGGFGSLVDSLLGATIQASRFSNDSKRIIAEGGKRRGHEEIKVISGLDILSNNQVNLVSSIVTALVLAYFA